MHIFTYRYYILSNDTKITSVHYIFLQQLKYYTQIHVRSTRGKNAKGSKITGVEPLPGEDKVRKREEMDREFFVTCV